MSTARRFRASRGHRYPITVRPTNVDIAVAREIARDTAPVPEEVARFLTWGADKKVLLALAAAGWLASRGQEKGLRRSGNHVALVAVAAALLPHGMKRLFNQTRPDRRTVIGHVHGISFSGKREDAFPSGHALHMGALASAAGTLPTRPRWAIRAFRDWALADASSSSGALGERRCRGIRSRSHSRTAPSPVDWLPPLFCEEGRSCQYWKTLRNMRNVPRV
jgi:hypothetical protein